MASITDYLEQYEKNKKAGLGQPAGKLDLTVPTTAAQNVGSEMLPQIPVLPQGQAGVAPESQLATPQVESQGLPGQVRMMNGIEVRGKGSERFAFGTPDVPETLYSTGYSDPYGPNGAARSDTSIPTDAPASAAQTGFNAPDVGLPSDGIGQVDSTTPFFQEPESQVNPMLAPQDLSSGGLTTAGGQPLAEFLAGGQQLDAQGRMIDPKVDRSSFEQQSADREARAAENFGQPRGPDSRDRDRRGTMSMEDATKLTGGNRSAATALLKRQELGLGEFEVQAPSESDILARERFEAEQAALKSKQDKKADGGMTFDQKLALRKQEFAEMESKRKAKVANSGLKLTPGEQKIDTDAATDMNDWRMNGSALAQSNMTQLSEVIGDLEDGNIDTRNFSDFSPMSDSVRALFNPTGQDALDKVRGVIFQSLKATLGGQFAEKEGIRLVEAAYNPKLPEDANIDRLGALLRRTQAAAQAKDQMSQYFQENGTLKGYSGAGVRAAFDSSTGAQGAKGSPIKGDVDYATEVDSRLGNYK